MSAPTGRAARQVTVAQEFDQMWLPLWPLASDDLLHGVYRMTRGAALKHRYLEANPSALSNLLVVDVDHVDGALRALGSIPRPTAVVENPMNGHAHAVWALSEPITRTEYAHRKPLAFAASVTEGLRRSLDGDRGYSGLITKNPTHDSWECHWLSSELRSLGELAEELGEWMPPISWRQQKARRLDPIGLGRNCALFESSRHWAYREIRNHWGDPTGLANAVEREAFNRNADFSEPLPASEVRAIASSIHRWIINHSRMWADGPAVYEATFSTIQSARARRERPASRTIDRQALIEAVTSHDC